MESREPGSQPALPGSHVSVNQLPNLTESPFCSRRTFTTIAQGGCVYFSVNGPIVMRLCARNLILLKANHLLKAKELTCLAKTVKAAGMTAALNLLLTNCAMKWK